ncbi:ergosterol biosynthesis protein-like protein Erg28 [Penicillium alfredii]|uniref:Ergosterol biosynthesis protein-like protein Erg28 n=1 Tax=Penicillium alfredii TaxID=1506179 RepID=A0A9W9EMJ0_9EURO|nr:ergosterol biosynthesis protein-like protein Erg28 [Penicillium alfredii]KAJ5084490.1 ergosterol biosynthesis protein-like protein Erg28 [Penicillium alfredii]
MSLPNTEEGYLPYLLLLTGSAGITHSIVTYLKPATSLTQFSGPAAPPRDALTAHLYGFKNIYTCLIRLYTAYHVSNPQLYDLAMWTWVGVFVLYISELLVFRTARMKEATYPLVLSTLALTWMVSQRSWYQG